MTKRLALITGASAGIGVAFAEAYARRGCDLVLVARRRDRLEALAQRLAGASVLAVDLAAPDAPEQIVAGLDGRRPDILVNNAGYSIAQKFLAVDWPAQRAFIQVLATSAAGLCHHLLPAMIERRWGRIVNVASIAAFSPGAAGHTLYPAVKSFMVKMSQSLAAEVKPQGVHVTALCPGQTESEFADANGTRAAIAKARMGTQKAATVVEIGIRANEAGREVVVPGLHNKLAAAALKVLPDGLTAALIRPVAARFSLPE